MPTTNDFARRTFLAAATAAATSTAKAQLADIPIIDTHVHLYDTTRPQGVPYPTGANTTTMPPKALPAVYRSVAQSLGIVGAIELEASPWIEDNLWILETIAPDSLFVGTIGNLEPEKPEFTEYLARYRKNKLFLGIRCGNLWGRNLAAQVEMPQFIAGIEQLAAAGLTMDSANPSMALIESLVKLTAKVPTLRVVIDHLPSFPLPTDAAQLRAYEANLRELRKRNVFTKFSAIVRRVNGQPQLDPAFYKDTLDFLFEIWGEDRVVYGSDWPNSAGNWYTYQQALAIVKPYFMAKGRAAAEKYFWRNSVAAYKWIKRDPSQPV
jgi:predicted TIM-barrel fold metal-dependent hydrolase